MTSHLLLFTVNYGNLPNLYKFSTRDEINLIHTTFMMAWFNEISYSTPASMTNYLNFANEESVGVWKTVSFHIAKLANICEHRSSFVALRV